MKIYDLEAWRKSNNIIEGRHTTRWVDETVEAYIVRCSPFETCDYCGEHIRVDKGKRGIQSIHDVGDWKCAEYSCSSYICESCLIEGLYQVQSSVQTARLEE